LYLLPDCSNIQGISQLLTMCVSCHPPMVMKIVGNYQCWFPRVVTGEKNSPTAAHAGLKKAIAVGTTWCLGL
jgi:predicted metal-dependent TIM-barrel fold hydrolase